MANWSTLKTAVADIINTNGNQAITGQLLQNVLNNIITNVGENATFAGIATVDTNPGAPDGPVFYLTATAGAYPNFNSLEVLDGEAVIFEWDNGTWSKKLTGFATQEKLTNLQKETDEKLSQLGSKQNLKAIGNFEFPNNHSITINSLFIYGTPNNIQTQYSDSSVLKNHELIVNTYSKSGNLVLHKDGTAEVIGSISSLDNDDVILLRYNENRGGICGGILYENYLDECVKRIDKNQNLKAIGSFDFPNDHSIKIDALFIYGTPNNIQKQYSHSSVLKIHELVASVESKSGILVLHIDGTAEVLGTIHDLKSDDIILLRYNESHGGICGGILYENYLLWKINLNDDYTSIRTIIQPTNSYKGKGIENDGSLSDASSADSTTYEFQILSNSIYYANGYSPSSSSSKVAIAYYNKEGVLINSEKPKSSEGFTDFRLTVPDSTSTVRIFGTVVQGASLIVVENNKEYIDFKVSELNSTYISQDVESYYQKKGIGFNGALQDADSEGAITFEYTIDSSKEYKVNGYCPQKTENGLVPIAYYDLNGLNISAEHPYSSETLNGYKLTIPNNAVKLRIFGNSKQLPVLFKSEGIEDLSKATAIPQIFNNLLTTKKTDETIKILFFGSSWFMNTWWYLNKIIKDLGINAELYAYYMGSSEFKEWIDFYNNKLTPFDISRRATRNISINGADWTISTYGEGYTAQQYRDDWYNDLTSGDWDIIAFQQGAKQAPFWEDKWLPYWDKIISIIKENCNPRTTIAFNSTWTPVEGNSYLSGLSVDEFLSRNFENTKKFMLKGGIYNVSPNGKLIKLMRDSEFNSGSNDMADDGLHPNNGLPMFGLSACFYETFIAPIYGISIKECTWLPTEETQKALVSGTSFDAINEIQKEKIVSLVKKALSQRFLQ